MPERRTLDEIFAMHRFEPDLRDLYVEGCTDKSYFDWYLKANGLNSVSIYPIEHIDVPNAVLQKHQLSSGNRSRVIGLSYELFEQFPQGKRILCVADRDYEDYRPSVNENDYLLLTECNSLELYAFTPSTMEKFTSVALGGVRMSTAAFMATLTSVLEQLYAMRVANELLGWSMEWVPFCRYVEIEGLKISFDQDGFIRAYLQKNNQWHRRTEFCAKLKQVAGALLPDCGRRVRGHDLIELLLHVIRKISCNKGYSDQATLAGSLLATIDLKDLGDSTFFQRIRNLAVG